MEIIDKVIEWGRERQIDNPYRQLNKVLEEIGELAHEVCRDNLDTKEFRDAIGDSFVTLILLADMTGNNPLKCLEEAYNEISSREGHTSEGMFIKN